MAIAEGLGKAPAPAETRQGSRRPLQPAGLPGAEPDRVRLLSLAGVSGDGRRHVDPTGCARWVWSGRRRCWLGGMGFFARRRVMVPAGRRGFLRTVRLGLGKGIGSDIGGSDDTPPPWAGTSKGRESYDDAVLSSSPGWAVKHLHNGSPRASSGAGRQNAGHSCTQMKQNGRLPFCRSAGQYLIGGTDGEGWYGSWWLLR